MVDMAVDKTEVTFKLKKNAQKPYKLSLIGTNLEKKSKESFNGSPEMMILESKDFIHPRTKWFTLEHILIGGSLLLISTFLLVWCCLMRKTDDEEEELISSFIEDPNPEIRRITMRDRDKIKRSQTAEGSMISGFRDELSEEEITKRESELPEEFREYFDSLKGSRGSGESNFTGLSRITEENSVNSDG